MQLKYSHAHPNVMALNAHAIHRQFTQQQQTSDHPAPAESEVAVTAAATTTATAAAAAAAANHQRRASQGPMNEKHRLLMKRLELAFIEFFGKVMWRNGELKRIYAYTYDDALYARLPEIAVDQDTEWPSLTNTFIKITLNFLHVNLDQSQAPATTGEGGAAASNPPAAATSKTAPEAPGAHAADDTRDFQLEALRFVANLLDDDIDMQTRLVNAAHASTSGVLHCFALLMRTSSSFEVQKAALRSLWILTGGDNWQETYDRKFALYTTIGVHKFLEVLYELGEVDSNQQMFLYCLEALQIIGKTRQ